MSEKKGKKKISKTYPVAKQILMIAGIGAFIAGSLIMPGLPILLRGYRFEKQEYPEEEEWEQFDQRRLRRRLLEMRKKKLIRIYRIGERYAVQITEKGRKRLLQYKISDLTIPTPSSWDKKWRIVSYDVPKGKNRARDAMRDTLKRLGFLQLQKSVYLFPYPCNEAIDFIRELYGIGENVTLLTIGYLENEDAYKEYFHL